MLELWKTRENFVLPYPEELELGPQINNCLKESLVPLRENLNQKQRNRNFNWYFPKVFSALSGKVSLAHHQIDVEPGKVIQEGL